MPDRARANQPKPGLEGLADSAREFARRGPAPVHLWNPPYCGELDMRIAADGTWFYLGTPIGRPALVRLFASVLKRESEDYFLVTPVEKVGIRVDDAPFLAVEMAVEGERDVRRPEIPHQCRRMGDLRCRSWPALHAWRGRRLTPYLHVRSDLWAKVTRPLYYDLVERAGRARHRWSSDARRDIVRRVLPIAAVDAAGGDL